MKKIILILTLIVAAFIYKEVKSDEVIIPDTAIRLRVIPNSNSTLDQNMKNKVIITLSLFLSLILITGCGCNKKSTPKPNVEKETVVKDQKYEGLEFINVGINNNIIKEITDSVKEPVENGTTKTIETKSDIDLTNAASIEYSIVK